jgi:hypothetical protein
VSYCARGCGRKARHDSRNRICQQCRERERTRAKETGRYLRTLTGDQRRTYRYVTNFKERDKRNGH